MAEGRCISRAIEACLSIVRAPASPLCHVQPSPACPCAAIAGVGPYTSAAIGSIAFNDRAAVVDGNVVRGSSQPSLDLQRGMV